MQRMKLEKKINIFELVKQLRAQRMKMVQTLDQFTFLYDSALELVQAKAQQPQGESSCRSEISKKNLFVFPTVLQNIALYMNDFKLFSRFKKETNGSILRHSESSL